MPNNEKNSSTPEEEKIPHAKLRIIIAVLLLIFAVGSITYGLSKAIIRQPGWIEVTTTKEKRTGAQDFVFQYNIGLHGVTASAEYNELQTLYTKAMVKCYREFNNDKTFSGVHNVKYINEHPDEVIEVDEVLYQAFSKLDKSGLRTLYLAPVYDIYDEIFFTEVDEEAYEYDPFVNEELRKRFKKIAKFAGDEKQVQLELLGNNKVKLTLSDEYKAYAKKEDITSFIDFYWMKNAFIVDYVAEVMIKGNHLAGFVASVDGYTRNFDATGAEFNQTFYDLVDNQYYEAGTMQYKGGRNLVYLHNYSQSQQDIYLYHETGKGALYSRFVAEEDGLNKTSKNDLLLHSKDVGCADMILAAIPVYVTEKFSPKALSELSKDGIYSVYCQDRMIYSNDSKVSFSNLFDRDGITYKLAK